MQGKTNIMIEIMRKYGVNYYKWIKGTPNKQNKTGVKGVYFDKRHKSYRADIMVRGKKHYLGYFKSLDEASEARKNAENMYVKNLLSEIEKELYK